MRAHVGEGTVFFGNFRDRSPKIQSSSYYLEHEEEIRQIVDDGYELMMTELKFEKSFRKMVCGAQQHRIREQSRLNPKDIAQAIELLASYIITLGKGPELPMVVRTTIFASLIVPVSWRSPLRKLFVLQLVQKVKIIRMHIGTLLHLGCKARSVKALLRVKFENGFEEMLDEVGDFIGIRREDFPQFLWQFL